MYVKIKIKMTFINNNYMLYLLYQVKKNKKIKSFIKHKCKDQIMNTVQQYKAH